MPPPVIHGENAAGVLAVIKRRLPDPPALPAVKNLLKAPAGHEGRPVQAAYVVPNVLIGLLDCITDHDVDAAEHLDALGVRPVWRKSPGNLDGAARALVGRMRSVAASSCLVLLFGKDGKRLSPQEGEGESSSQPQQQQTTQAPPQTAYSLPDSSALPQAAAECSSSSSILRNACGVSWDDDSSSNEKAASCPKPSSSPGDTMPPPTTTTTQARAVRPRSCAAAHSARSSRKLFSGGILPPPLTDDDFIPLSRPAILLSRPASGGRPARSSSGGGGGADNGASAGASSPPPSQEEEAAATRLQQQWRAAMQSAAWQAAAKANAIVRGGPSAPPLQSQHFLPTQGNWVRLAAGQQYAVRREAETSRRLAAEGMRSFGSEPRLSGSRRWAHQTQSGQLGGGARVHAGVTRDGNHHGQRGAKGEHQAVVPGSFLPLKAFASVMHKSRSRGPLLRDASETI